MASKTVKSLRIILPVLGLASMIFFVPWTILWAWLAPIPDSIQEQVEKAPSFGLDGILVYVDQGGQDPEFHSAGWNDRDKKTLADPQAYFKIASISKLYIAAATAKLLAKKQLALDQTLAELLPELHPKINGADQISLKMLLQHRSGIPNYTDTPDFPWDNPPTNGQALELIFGMEPDFAPDSQYAYSNTNYLLIGEILDKTLGYGHQKFIRQEILLPHQLTHTFGSLNEVDPSMVMSGYSVGYPLDVKGNDYTLPGGSMVATISDVGRFLRYLTNGSLLSPEEQTIYSEIYEFGHTGLLPGYSSIARYHPDLDAVVVQFVNTSGGESWTITEIIYEGILKILGRNHSDKDSE